MFRVRHNRESTSRTSTRRGSVGSASVWDAERRAGRGQTLPEPLVPPASEPAPPAASELVGLVTELLRTALETHLAGEPAERRLVLGRALEERLRAVLGTVPAADSPSASPPAENAASTAEAPVLAERESAATLREAATTDPEQATLARVLDERLIQVGGILSRRPDLRRRLIELGLTTVSDKDENEPASEPTGDELRDLDLLQRRAAKLERSLLEARAALSYVSGLAHVDSGLASIYRDVQGLASDDPLRARKAGALEAVFQANVELQKGAGGASSLANPG